LACILVGLAFAWCLILFSFLTPRTPNQRTLRGEKEDTLMREVPVVPYIKTAQTDYKRWHRSNASRSFHASECPPVPPADYPYEWPIMEIIDHWNPDQTVRIRHGR
jgi:hypothetical protein